MSNIKQKRKKKKSNQISQFKLIVQKHVWHDGNSTRHCINHNTTEKKYFIDSVVAFLFNKWWLLQMSFNVKVLSLIKPFIRISWAMSAIQTFIVCVQRRKKKIKLQEFPVENRSTCRKMILQQIPKIKTKWFPCKIAERRGQIRRNVVKK